MNSIITKKAEKYHIDANFLQSIVLAEGNIIKAVQCTSPDITTLDQALNVLCNSATHRLLDYCFTKLFKEHPEYAKEFVAYFGSFWAPVGASNDPKGLNKNWVPNVIELWGKS